MMTVYFNEETHTYTIDGYVLPSVNQVLKSVATRKNDDYYWKSISGVEFITDPSYAEFGKKFHALIAAIENGYKVTYNDEIKGYVKSYEMFYEMYPELKCSMWFPDIEKSLGYFKNGFGFAGTPDVIIINDIIVIVDWKTGKTKKKLGNYNSLLMLNYFL